MSRSNLTTYQDLLENLRDFFGGTIDAANQSKFARCCDLALEGVIGAFKWAYYTAESSIELQTPYSTGTVSYDATGGTYERQLTLAGGTWPDWTFGGKVRIGQNVYEVEDRKSNTVITLTLGSAPRSDFASTSYSLVKDTYPLPDDFVTMGQIDLVTIGEIAQISSGDMMRMSRLNYSSNGSPTCCAIIGDPSLYGRMAVMFYPTPYTNDMVKYVYRRRPRSLKHTGYKTQDTQGKVTLTTSGRTVTGTGTAFDQTMVGAVIRIGTSTTDPPDGRYGKTPAVDERIILEVTDATTLVIDNVPSQNFTNVKYTISDPVDADPVLIPLIHRACERQAAFSLKTTDGTRVDAIYQGALLDAMAADSRLTAPSVVTPGYYVRAGFEDTPTAQDNV